MPADLVLRTGEAGKPYLAGDGLEALGGLPELSVAHVEGEAVAVAAAPGVPVGVDLERTARVEIADLLRGGFSEGERAMLSRAGCDARRVLQAWCAKEAAAKCLGTGFDGQPHNFVLCGIDDSGNARVDAAGAVLRVSLAAEGSAVLAVAYA